MSHIVTKLILSLLLIQVLITGSAVSGQPAPEGELFIVTPQWEGQTNADGTGLFFDIVRAVYSPRKIPLQIQFAPWKRCQAMVEAGQVHAMLCVWEAHAKKHGQITPRNPLYIEQTAAVFKKASGISWHGIFSLDYKRVVWLRGYNYHEKEEFAGVQPLLRHEVDTQSQAWEVLNRDRADILIDALIDIEGYMKDHEGGRHLYQTELLWTDKAYVAFSDTPYSRQLIRIYDEEIKKLVASGELAGIYRRWGQVFQPEYWGN